MSGSGVVRREPQLLLKGKAAVSFGVIKYSCVFSVCLSTAVTFGVIKYSCVFSMCLSTAVSFGVIKNSRVFLCV